MAYTHSKYEVPMLALRTTTDVADGANVLSVTDVAAIASWSPGFMPHLIRAVVATPLTTNLISGLGILLQVTGGSSITIASFNFTSGDDSIGTAVYWDNLNHEVVPGDRIIASVSQLGGAQAGTRLSIMLYVEPRWETPANISGMRQTVT